MIPVNLHPCDEMSWKTKLFDKELQLARLLHFEQIVIFVHNVFDLGECLSKAKHKNTTFFGLAQKKDGSRNREPPLAMEIAYWLLFTTGHRIQVRCEQEQLVPESDCRRGSYYRERLALRLLLVENMSFA